MRLALGPLLGFAAIAAFGCATPFNDFTGKESALEDAQRRYTELVRWGEIESASAYVDPAATAEFLDFAGLFADIRFTDYESGPLQFTDDSNTATVNVIYRAYSTRTLVEKKIRVRQEWYREASADNAWRVRPDLGTIASALNGSQ